MKQFINVKKLLLALCLFGVSIVSFAEEQDSIVSVKSQESGNTLMSRLQQAQAYLDSAASKKVDPRYIEVPAKPWRVILRYKMNGVDVDYESRYNEPEKGEYADWRMNFDPSTAHSIGFWVGYRGTGISYSKALAKNAGRYFSFSSTGAKYGINFRLRRFKTDETELHVKEFKDDQQYRDSAVYVKMYEPVIIRSVYINGYYVFNGRRYSQAAAYNQSVIQRRSAGSFLLGATWYQSSFDFSDSKNFGWMHLSHGVGRIKLHQASIGVGYGYNFVPFRGFVVNAMAMPTVSFYNRVKLYKYDFNYDFSDPDGKPEDYGAWNPQTKTWANGKTHKSIYYLEDINDVQGWETGTETEYGALKFNLDLRLGMAYNWSNYFIGLQAQFNSFAYKKDYSQVTLFDWYARASFGIRL